MTPEESGIMKDAFFFLRDHDNPPANGVLGCEQYWAQAARQITELGRKWNHHPLVLEVLPAIYGYLETRSRQKAGDAP